MAFAEPGHEVVTATKATTEYNNMEYYGLMAIIVCCGLIADNMNIKTKLKRLEERVTEVEASKS